MKFQAAVLIVFSATFLMSSLCHAEIKTVVERNVGGDARGEFKFKSVPTPSRTDAGNSAKFTILNGRRDGNGGELVKLNDGRLPEEDDQPAANFFFAAGTEGGRLLMDLGEVIELRQVNTYSWHRMTRGPQVYKLYAGDAASEGFKVNPDNDTDLEKAGWKLIAAVDTRPKEGGT